MDGGFTPYLYRGQVYNYDNHYLVSLSTETCLGKQAHHTGASTVAHIRPHIPNPTTATKDDTNDDMERERTDESKNPTENAVFEPDRRPIRPSEAALRSLIYNAQVCVS